MVPKVYLTPSNRNAYLLLHLCSLLLQLQPLSLQSSLVCQLLQVVCLSCLLLLLLLLLLEGEGPSPRTAAAGTGRQTATMGYPHSNMFLLLLLLLLDKLLTLLEEPVHVDSSSRAVLGGCCSRGRGQLTVKLYQCFQKGPGHFCSQVGTLVAAVAGAGAVGAAAAAGDQGL